jgi:hypothetical protein|tara:strand:- start:407 stop:769 length:363 start_codon:yes stop_codon:yes gene_type:complete
MDPSVDFMPTQKEFEIIVEKIEKTSNKRRLSTLVHGPREKPYPGVLPYDYHTTEAKKHRLFCMDHKNSDLFYDTYDDYGRNISKQERRQELVPWVRVAYRKGKLYIPVDKKNALRSLRLL